VASVGFGGLHRAITPCIAEHGRLRAPRLAKREPVKCQDGI
jgi:hypothetical protein